MIKVTIIKIITIMIKITTLLMCQMQTVIGSLIMITELDITTMTVIGEEIANTITNLITVKTTSLMMILRPKNNNFYMKKSPQKVLIRKCLDST